ncbi:DNA polymerase III subunit delta [Novosphingobium sp. G106]|uniref:DNA polymerase III subunit delta n=1 Tax=Novosphingobium sp. G106 TaxID=2849500 RepID=UPI001C2D39B6|nr:DNA polymerase III subunit delta [Novosphingobium sp. G106]MBV1690180.1 DNA polymerase III subunit delta [Novosphingobium sp. G106]
MKATQRDFAGMAARASGAAKVFFFCGPDEAGAHDAAQKILSLLPDPGERVELSGGDLKRDPVKLGDEARSNSLFGDTRHILIRAQGDEVYDAVEVLLSGEVEPCPVLIVAVGATDKSRTAKLLADRPDALVAMFHPPDLKSVAASVRAMADAAGLRIGGDLAERIARAAGLDTRLARSEVTKLALYLDASAESPRSADAAALDAIGAKTEEDGFGALVNAVLGGEKAKIPGELKRIRELGLNPVGLLLAIERRAAQLAALAAKLGPKGDVTALLKAEVAARRVFWKDERELGAQLRQWRGRKLERLVDKLVGMHRSLLTNSQDADLLLSQGLAEIARAAAG